MHNCNSELSEWEKRTRRLELWLRASVIAWALTLSCAALWMVSPASRAQSTTDPAKIRASEIVIVDNKGVERVRIGGELPDAVIGGKRVARGQQAAGIVLYDASGSERSGYVTFEPSGNVGLTLDSKTMQVASFIASAEGNASAFSLWHGKDMVELRSDAEGSRLSAVKNGEVLVQTPPIPILSPDMCSAYKSALSRVAPAQVTSDCRRRFTAAACGACLGRK